MVEFFKCLLKSKGRKSLGKVVLLEKLKLPMCQKMGCLCGQNRTKTKEIICEGKRNTSDVPLQQHTELSEGDYRPSKNITVCQFLNLSSIMIDWTAAAASVPVKSIH